MAFKPLVLAVVLAVAAADLVATTGLAQAAASCQARSGPGSVSVVELFTSEGCSSCPPADRWLSTLKGRPDVLALAFHVNYWDRLGWPDRFATAEATARQREQARLAGSSQVYTPQVLVGGRDWRQWPQLPASAAAPVVSLKLTRSGDQVNAEITAGPQSPARLAGYWAVLEDGHVSTVRSGENAGSTLRHDHVVRLYRPVPAWAAAQGGAAQLSVSRGDPAFPRRVVFVVTDASGARPLQAVALAC
jgi:hypothetical protein